MRPTTRNGFLRAQSLFASLLACAAGALMLAAASGARAEPYLAIQEGYKCSKCHVNMTGGGKRTDFANAYVQTRLANEFLDWRRSAKKVEDEAENPVRTDSQNSFFSGRLNEYIAIGGDFRALFERTDTRGSTPRETFNQRKQTIYLEIDVIPERAVLYQTLAEGGDAREIFGLLKGEIKDQPYYVKAGQFFLPYGLRLQDDTAYTRAVPGFTYGITDVGVEVGFEPGPWALHLAATNGTGSSQETNRSKRITGSAAYVSKMFRLGASYSTNKSTQGNTTITGINGGAQFGRVGVLADVSEVKAPSATQRVSILELNFLIFRGNNLKLTYEYHDPSTAIFENARVRNSLVYEPFINQFTQLRGGIRRNKGIPQDASQSFTAYFFDLHLFF